MEQQDFFVPHLLFGVALTVTLSLAVVILSLERRSKCVDDRWSVRILSPVWF